MYQIGKTYCKYFVSLCVFVPLCAMLHAQRADVLINDNWQSKLINDASWKTVNLPHNWDQYYGYRRLLHGNLHDTAVYRKRYFLQKKDKAKKYLIQFEGVGSYATVSVNGDVVGNHAGGRTSFTFDITTQIKQGNNLIEVTAAHPAHIKDLPWVCGGCSDERGFSEGSQPLGIFRNVHLITVNQFYIPPHGVHVWAELKGNNGILYNDIRVNNPTNNLNPISVEQLIIDKSNNKIVSKYSNEYITTNNTSFPVFEMPFKNINLWSLTNPVLYKIVTRLKQNGKIIDEQVTDFGFRTIKWAPDRSKLWINDEQIFINGIAEYEHLMGTSHSFSEAQIKSRISWIQSTGFNAFRDAHQPHNLLYGKLLNETGMLWWPQFSAHIWYDDEDFKFNFKKLLEQWVVERRNDPANFMWGIQNESKLPKEFTEECTALIRSLDPTASAQRLVTTCNGGSGADWDVPQNWSGTYGGNPNNYGNELKQQKLVGEYGAWRTLDKHTESTILPLLNNSEEKACHVIETKIREANRVKDSVVGHFFWLFNSHENPGRVQGGEGERELDRVGPVNYKGLLTAWEEPTDLYYLFKSNFTDKNKSPMVYIVAPNWQNKINTAFATYSFEVYSNCDEVELFNDKGQSLGKQKNRGVGTHFVWNNVVGFYKKLIAKGYIAGKFAAQHEWIQFEEVKNKSGVKNDVIENNRKLKNILHYNFGGDVVQDNFGNVWLPDESIKHSKKNYGTISWTDDFENMAPYYASQRRSFVTIDSTNNDYLFQTFRYGTNKFNFEINNLPKGKYYVDLFFSEPWVNAIGQRVFDIAINNKVVTKDFDIFSIAKSKNVAIKKSFEVDVTNGSITLSFPSIKTGQALINALRISTLNTSAAKPVNYENVLFKVVNNKFATVRHWLDYNTSLQNGNSTIILGIIPYYLFGASFLQHQIYLKDTLKLKMLQSQIVYLVTNDVVKDKRLILIDSCNMFNSFSSQKIYKQTVNKADTLFYHYGNYGLLCFTPLNQMQPAFDLKPIVQFKANLVNEYTNAVKEEVNQRICMVIKDDKESFIQFPITIGAADIYSFTTKYYQELLNHSQGALTLKDENGIVHLQEQVTFTPTKPGKWNQFTFSTKNMINAGKYIMEYKIINGTKLALNGIDVQ